MQAHPQPVDIEVDLTVAEREEYARLAKKLGINQPILSDQAFRERLREIGCKEFPYPAVHQYLDQLFPGHSNREWQERKVHAPGGSALVVVMCWDEPGFGFPPRK